MLLEHDNVSGNCDDYSRDNSGGVVVVVMGARWWWYDERWY